METRVRRAEEEMWAFRDANRIISSGAESTVLLSLFTRVRGDIERARQLAATRTELRLERSNLALEVTDPHPRLQAGANWAAAHPTRRRDHAHAFREAVRAPLGRRPSWITAEDRRVAT